MRSAAPATLGIMPVTVEDVEMGDEIEGVSAPSETAAAAPAEAAALDAPAALVAVVATGAGGKTKVFSYRLNYFRNIHQTESYSYRKDLTTICCGEPTKKERKAKRKITGEEVTAQEQQQYVKSQTVVTADRFVLSSFVKNWLENCNGVQPKFLKNFNSLSGNLGDRIQNACNQIAEIKCEISESNEVINIKKEQKGYLEESLRQDRYIRDVNKLVLSRNLLDHDLAIANKVYSDLRLQLERLIENLGKMTYKCWLI